MTSKDLPFIYGIHPVREALRASTRKCYKIVVEKGKASSRLRDIFSLAEKHRIRVETLPPSVFQKKYRDIPHQGIIGYFSVKAPVTLDELIEGAKDQAASPILVLLDEIQDPQNLGAIIRSAEGFGLQGLILPRHRSAQLNETVAKCSAGAVESLPVATVANLTQAVEILKTSGYWVAGIDPHGEKPVYEFDFGEQPTALVLGGEFKGIRPRLKANCDFLLSIPRAGRVESLNASAAAAVVFYEILRQKQSDRK